MWFLVAPGTTWVPLASCLALVTAIQILIALVSACWSPAVRRVWVFGAWWLAAALIPLAQKLYIAPTGEGVRLFYIPAAALSVMIAAPLTAWPLRTGQEHKPGYFPLVLASINALLIGALSVSLLITLLDPWREAGKSMRAIIPAIAERAEKVPENHLAVLLLPDHIEGAPFGRNCQGALMEPPVQADALTDRILVVTPPTLQEPDFRLKAFSELEYWCWNTTTRQFERLTIPPYSPETWVEAWRAALDDSHCQTLADEVTRLQQ
jgi:hypothetical protein